jgi:hypothetical protein
VPDKIVKRRLGHSLRASKLFGKTPIVSGVISPSAPATCHENLKP